MRTLIIRRITLLMLASFFGTALFAQPLSLGVIKGSAGNTGGIGFIEYTENCEGILHLKVRLANLDLYSTSSNQGDTYHFPAVLPKMYLEYSVNDGPIEYVELTSFGFYSEYDGVNVYQAEIETYTFEIDSDCIDAPDENSAFATYTMRLVLRNPDTALYETYPACDYTGYDEIFSCSVFEYAYDSCEEDGAYGSGFSGNNDGPLRSKGGSNTDTQKGPTPKTCDEYRLTTSNYFFQYFCTCKTGDLEGSSRRLGYDANNFDNFGKLETTVQPNPFNDILELKWTGISNVKLVELYDIQGKRILLYDEDQLQDLNKFTLETNFLNSGIYFLKVTTNSASKTQKIIKQ